MTSEPAPATRDALSPQVIRPDAPGPQLVTTEDPPRRSRAGRNLPVAVAVSVGLAALVLVSLFTVKDIFVGVVIAAMFVAIWELGTAMREHAIRLPYVPVGVGTVAILVAS